MTAIGIDYGESRIGVAASDPLGMLAHPVETVQAQPHAAALERIRQWVGFNLGLGLLTIAVGVSTRAG